MTRKRFLHLLPWHRHHWHRTVTATEYLPDKEFNMWSRPVYGRSVTCATEYVCDECGKTRGDLGCICDTEEGEHCPIRLECLAKAAPTAH